MTTIAQSTTNEDHQQQIADLLAVALGDFTSALSDSLGKLLRAELKKQSGATAVNNAVKLALPKILERSFHDSLLDNAAEQHQRRIALLHLLTSAEVQHLGAGRGPVQKIAQADELAESLTTEETAKLLSVSRTHVLSLVDTKALPVSLTRGGHRRIPKAAVLEYKQGMKARQAKGLDAMMEASAAMGLYDGELEGIPRRSKRRA